MAVEADSVRSSCRLTASNTPSVSDTGRGSNTAVDDVVALSLTTESYLRLFWTHSFTIWSYASGFFLQIVSRKCRVDVGRREIKWRREKEGERE